MDLERDELRRRYQFCRIAFGLIALGVGLLFIDSGCHLALMLSNDPELRSVVTSPAWDWMIGAPITWCTVVGAYLLLGRSSDPSWQRRAGLLVVFNGIDLLSWVLDHNVQLGMNLGDIGHDWLRLYLARGLGWAEFILFASMAAEMAAELGRSEAIESGLSARSLATIGLFLCILAFVTQTNWRHGWPLGPRRLGMRSYMMTLGSSLLWTISAFQVTALSISACRLCGKRAAEMGQDDDPHELLRSRSETFDGRFTQDDDPWR